MTLPPSWAFCIDIGGRHAGVVSGTMNMAGNVGSFVTSLAFPYLLAFTGSTTPFFLSGAVLNLAAASMLDGRTAGSSDCRRRSAGRRPRPCRVEQGE